VIPLFKIGDKSLPSNYRPVSLLSCVRKIFEKIVFKNIFNHLHRNKLRYFFRRKDLLKSKHWLFRFL
jgi:hypothetical protein